MSIFDALNALIEDYYADAASDSPSAKLYADHINLGMPSSGARKPHKPLIRQYLRIIERAIDGTKRRVTVAGAVTADASTDDVIRIAKSSEAATAVNLPTVTARLAAHGGPIFIKNEMSNGALYPLTLTPAGTDTIEGEATFTMDGQRQGVWLWPDDSLTPNNWEIR